jgi:ribose transport system ATP-binding protein
LEIRGLSKTFAQTRVLNEVSFALGAGEIHSLLGANGSGKSTLIKILSGYHLPDPGGSVRVNGTPLEIGAPDHAYALGCRFVHQDLGLMATMSVADNLLIGCGFPSRFGTIRSRVAARAATEMLRQVELDVSPRRAVGTLSPAERTAVAVARALRIDDDQPANVLVLDEPTATLPPDEVDRLLETVQLAAARGVGVLLVTHRLSDVLRVAESVTVLRDGRVIETAAAKDLDRASLLTLLTGDEELELPARRDESPTSEQAAIVVQNLWAGPLKGISLSARTGEIVGIAGLTGSGRETVLPAIYGGVAREQGRVCVKEQEISAERPDLAMQAGIGFLPGDRKAKGGHLGLTARENMALASQSRYWSRGRLRRSAERAVCSEWFAKLNIRPADGVERPLALFSGGNQQKVLLAKWLIRNPQILFLDDPTQGVDVGSKAELHQKLIELARQGMTMLISSTDTEELAAICDRIVVLRDGKIASCVDGGPGCGGQITRALMWHKPSEVS